MALRLLLLHVVYAEDVLNILFMASWILKDLQRYC